MPKPAKSARDAAIQIITRLRETGYTAYLAGGCVRDALLGQSPKDYDVATDATPDDVLRLFPRAAPVGAAFGVVLVYTHATDDRPRWATEIATFRAEGAYSDGRHPDDVRFTSAEEDAKRRDFTINGLFAETAEQTNEHSDGSNDRIIDYVGGREDLKSQTIRAIGDPSERFGEDYLRMLRAVRFASRLGFEIEPRTAAAIRAHARYLGQISKERIGQELLAMLSGPNPTRALQLLQDLKLDGPTLKEDPNPCDLTISGKLTDDAKAYTRLSAWLLDRHGKTHSYQPIITRWRKALLLSNDLRDSITRQLALLIKLEDWQGLLIANKKRFAASPVWHQTLILMRAIGGPAEQIIGDTEQLKNDGVGLSPKPLLNGEDLIANGFQPGPAFKTLLDLAYDKQLEGLLQSRDDALAWLKDQAGRA